MYDKKLTHDFYNRDTVLVARELLGKYLVHVINDIEMVGKIVEVEAYLGAHDLAAHSSKGLTPRTKVMFGPPGHAYVYLIYGMYHCMNIVTEPEGNGSAVLLRALEPIKNMNELRTNGPGLLCKAMHIDLSLNGCDLTCDHFFVAEKDAISARQIISVKRIGVDYAGSWALKRLRFYIKNNPYVSKK